MKNGKVAGHLQESCRIDKLLESMEAAGIDFAVLSAGANSVDDSRITDDLYLKVIKEYPKQFAGFAPCIPTGGKEALKELERAIESGLKGVVISPQNDGAPLDSHEMWLFYKLVSRLKVPILVHVTLFPVGYEALDAPYNLNVTITREFDVAASTVRIILGGVLAEFPDLRFVMPHLGGGISSILERLERYLDTWGDRFWTDLGGTPTLKKPHMENFKKYFSKIYFDLAGYTGGMNAVKCALTTISPQRLVFGTDYPYDFTTDPQGIRNYVENIRRLDLSAKSIEAILAGNATDLLGIR